jgi:hypothetical protein
VGDVISSAVLTGTTTAIRSASVAKKSSLSFIQSQNAFLLSGNRLLICRRWRQVQTSPNLQAPFEDPIKANPYLFAIRGGYLHVLGIGTVSGDWAVVGFADDSELFKFV